MNFQSSPEYDEIGVQTDDNSMDQYDDLECYFNPYYFANQDQLIEELYKEIQDEAQTKQDYKSHSQSLGNLEDFQQSRPQTFNFHTLEKYSDTVQKRQKQPLNIGQLYLQQLEKQASTLKKIELKFAVNNANVSNNNNGVDENSSIAGNQKRPLMTCKSSVRSSYGEYDFQQLQQQEAKRGSCQTSFYDNKTNNTVRQSNKPEENKYYSQQLYLPSNFNEHKYIKQKINRISQHSATNLISQDDNESQSPHKKSINTQSNKIRAMTTNQQFQSGFSANKKIESQNANLQASVNSQLNQLNCMFSDFQKEIKHREVIQTPQSSNNYSVARVEQPNKAVPIQSLLSTKNSLQSNQKYISGSRQLVYSNQSLLKQYSTMQQRHIQSAKFQKQNFMTSQDNKSFQNSHENNISSTQSSLSSQQQIQFKKSVKQVQFIEPDKDEQVIVSNNNFNAQSIACIN